MSVLHRRRNRFPIARSTWAMNMSVRKFAALTSNDFPSTPASFHKSNKAIGIYSIQKPNFSSELLIGIPYFAQPSNRYVKRERSGKSHELIHIWILPHAPKRKECENPKANVHICFRALSFRFSSIPRAVQCKVYRLFI